MKPAARSAKAPFRLVPSTASAMRRRRERCVSAGTASGFTLLEVMIAFLIAGLALGVLFQSGLSSLQSIQTAARYEEALARARSRLAIAVHGAPLVAGDLEGEDGGGYGWRVRVTPVSNTAVRPFGMRGAGRPTWVAVALYSVTVWVWWTDRPGKVGPRREVRLETQHIEAAPQ
jgi:general secretion pathway protein I